MELHQPSTSGGAKEGNARQSVLDTMLKHQSEFDEMYESTNKKLTHALGAPRTREAKNAVKVQFDGWYTQVRRKE